TRARSCSGLAVEFFFEPLQLHVEASDLLVQRRGVGAAWSVAGVGGSLEEFGGVGEELLAPLVDLVGVDAELGGEFGDGACLLESSERDLGLERRTVEFVGLRHPCS